MNRNLYRARLCSMAMLLLATAACQHATSSVTQYVPASASGSTNAKATSDKKVKITSSCPRLIIIGLGRTQACSFQEAGYKGKFHIVEDPDEYYLFSVSPTVGKSDTSFIVTGLSSGGGRFEATDKQGNHIVRQVRVSL